VIHQKNQGQAAARNHAMTQAKGEWICFVDSDDLIHPGMLEALYGAVQDTKAPVAMCQMLEAVTLPEDFRRDREMCFTCLTMDEETLAELYDRDAYPAWVACAKLIRRDLIEHYPFHEGRVYEDNEAVCHWVCEGRTLAKLEQQLYFYRTNEGSTTKSNFSVKKLDYLWALERIIRYYGSLGYHSMRLRFWNRYVDAVVSSCNGMRYILKQDDLVKEIKALETIQ
jgi:glycosyltransferase involved in cell wall biosynthesis